MRGFMRSLVGVACLGLAGYADARTSVIVLPPDYAGPKEALLRQFADTLAALSPSDRVMVYAARGPTQLTTVAVPNDPKAQNAAWLKRRLGEQFLPVLRYLADLPATPAGGHPSGNLMIPDVLDEIGRNVIPSLPEKRADILLIGSWLYFDARDGRSAMTERYYPSDGHFAAPPSESPYGIAGRRERLTGATVHFCWPDGQAEFATKEHEEAVRRVWSLWTTAQSGRAGTFSYDMATCFRRFRAGEASGQTVYEISKDGKIEMLRAPPPVPATLPPTMERPGEYFLRDDVPISRTPPTTPVGIAWIGLKWNAPCDIDLYARPDSSSQWLYFGRVRTADGRFNKDHRTATGNQQFEFVEFVKPIDLRKGEVAINIYSGHAPGGPEGLIRVWFGGQVYEAPFKLTATQGNGGRTPMSGPHWIKVDLREVVGLPRS